MSVSSFFGFNTAITGLFTAQKQLEIINHNINNVNTPGYSRQVAEQTAGKPYYLPGVVGVIGTGSEISSIYRVRDEYLNYKYWNENMSYGEWSAKMELLADMEATFNEPSESGFTTIMNDFFASLQELSKDPSSEPVRALVQQNGITLANYFNNAAVHFEKLQSDINQRVRIKVEQINSIAVQIQQLNKQIYNAELDGSIANDLRDRRTVLVDDLSKIVNVEANEVIVSGDSEKHFVVAISGKSLVNHFNITKLEITQRDDNAILNEGDIAGLYEISWEDGNKFEAKSGELKGYIDIRDGNDGILGVDEKTASPSFKGIPFYIRKLNEFVRTFAIAFNEGYIDVNGNGNIEYEEDGIGHVDGFGLSVNDGDLTSSSTGIRFFTMIGDDGKPVNSEDFIGTANDIVEIADSYKNITAKNFSVSKDIATDPKTIAASNINSEAGNGEVLKELIELRHNTKMFTEGLPEDFMKSLIAMLGIDSEQAVRLLENKESVVKQLVNRRLADSGVSLDEEMAEMVRYQHAYNAAARMVTTMNEIYDTLINRLGIL